MPAENLIGEEGQGFRYILDGMNAERILVSRRDRSAMPLLHQQGGRLCQASASCSASPIGQNQGVQFPIARAYAEWKAADLMIRAGGGAVRGRPALRRGGQHGEAARVAKPRGMPARPACRPIGGFAAAREFDVERKWREARLSQIAPISTNLILAYIGQHVLGMPRSY